MRRSASDSSPALLVDTGPLVAAIDSGDAHHDWAARVLPRLRGRAISCEAVAAEALHLLENQPRAVSALRAIMGRIEISPLFARAQPELFALIGRYAPRMDLADACLVALSQRIKGSLVVTTDTRDFSLYRVPFLSPAGLFAP